jgi:folate-binding protein YgfZ
MIIGRMTRTEPAAVDVAAVADGAVRLLDWSLLRARGEDATTFLQGQLTNDLLSLPAGQARLAGYCSAKGRLLASFLGWQAGKDEWLLACSADVLPATLKRLSMFVLRARCKMDDGSKDLGIWGLAGAAGRQWLGEAAEAPVMSVSQRGTAQAVRLADVEGVPRWLVVSPVAEGLGDLPALPAATWQWLEVRSAVPRIVAATAEAFVPQMVNFELVGGVSFKKGCYPGQEVFDAADPGQPAGVVALAASAPDGEHLALVELKLAALAGNALHLGSAEGPALQPRALPYKLPQDEN